LPSSLVAGSSLLSLGGAAPLRRAHSASPLACGALLRHRLPSSLVAGSSLLSPGGAAPLRRAHSASPLACGALLRPSGGAGRHRACDPVIRSARSSGGRNDGGGGGPHLNRPRAPSSVSGVHSWSSMMQSMSE